MPFVENVQTHRRQWSLLSSHGQVLSYIAENPEATVRQLATALNFSERRIMGVLRDLEEVGMIHRQRLGRQNLYAVELDARVRAPRAGHVPLREFLAALATPGRPALADPSRAGGA
jgi:DNA-binding transcriptional ArsR family regulator